MVEAAHRWRLPAAKCLACGNTASDQELAYPEVDLPQGIKQKPYLLRWPVPWQKFEELARPIRPLVPAQFPLRPGTDFGSLKGDMAGPLTDFAWVWDWQCLVRKGVLERLETQLRINIPSVPAQITTRRKHQPDYLELIALPVVLLAEATKPKLPHHDCPNCGRYAAGFGDPIEVKKSSIPKDSHIFRIRELSAFVLCSEQFRQAVIDLGLENIDFAPIRVAEE